MGRYIARILRRESKDLVNRNTLHETYGRNPSLIAKIASIYNGGIAVGSARITQYGMFVSSVSKSTLVLKSLEKARGRNFCGSDSN